MHQASTNQSARTSPRAFLVQYLTLMLIVLSFMVGGFVTKATQSTVGNVGATPKATTGMVPAQVDPKDSFSLDLFQVGSSELHKGRAEALRSVFANHDLSARIKVSGDVGRSVPEALGQAMARGIALVEALKAPQIPNDAIEVVGTLDRRGTAVQIILFDPVEAPR